MNTLKDIVWSQIKSLRPSFLAKNPHFNFISVHYFWIIGLSLLGSVLIYGPGHGNIAYIDALAFAAGGSTQAGLNTVDVNKLNTFQQVVIYILAALANPITINSFVVILRLFWFEKRFQHIAHAARTRRRTISKSKTRARDDDLSRIEGGVNGRNITVIHNGANTRVANDGSRLGPSSSTTVDRAEEAMPTVHGSPEHVNTSHSASETSSVSPLEVSETRRPEIKFAPTVKRSDGLDDDVVKLPQRVSDEEHIAILERQRNPEDDEVLRIPGPRDAERGVLPSRVALGQSPDIDGESLCIQLTESRDLHAPYQQGTELSPIASRERAHGSANGTIVGTANGTTVNEHGSTNGHASSKGNANDRPPLRQAITIQEPDKPEDLDDFADDARAFINVFASFRVRRNPFSPVKKRSLPAQFKRRPTMRSLKTVFTRDKDADSAPYLSWQPTIGRNSVFIGMTDEQREELGGIEYRSLKTLAAVLFIYFWGFWLLGTICLVPWILRSHRYGAVVDAVAQNRTWWGFWTAHSAFMDLGFTLTPDSMNSFNTAVFPLLLLSFLIVIGNTGFPVMLRFVIWTFSLIVPRQSAVYEELTFLLDHPRRCFTLLFRSADTWWLFWVLVILNGIDLLFYLVLDLGSGPIFAMPPGVRVLDGLFQAFSTRTAGFACVNLADLHPAVQASYMIMMYISVFPIAISVRRTNVYEEDSLGVYNSADSEEPTGNMADMEYVGAHLRRQLSFDLWYLSLGFFILTISEGTRLQNNDFSMFAVLFEVISAYGTVGLSLGFPTANTSLCGQFTVVGKLVIIAMMVRGRHRGLPYGLDRAILLPSESLQAKDSDVAQNIGGVNGGASSGGGGNASTNGPVLVPTMTRRTSVASGGTQGLTLRGTPSNQHRRTRSFDRNNASIFTQFLHPGPPVSRASFSLPQPYRTFSETVIEEASNSNSRSSSSRAEVSGAELPDLGRGHTLS